MRRIAALLFLPLALVAPRVSAQCSLFTSCPTGGSGGGGGGVTSVGASVPSWLAVSGSPITSSGTLAITGASGLTTARVVGTCAGATSLALCQLGIADVPDLWNHTYAGNGRVEFDGGGGLNMIIGSGDFDIELDGTAKTIGLESYGGNISMTASGSTGSNGYIYMGSTAGVRLQEIAPTCGAGMADRFYARSTTHQLCYCNGTTEYCSGDAPALHGASHKHGGADEVATATPAANAIPKADGSGQLAAGWIPPLNQSTTGSAATLTTPRAIYGNNFDGSAALTQIIASTFGGTGNGFTKFAGPTTAEKTLTLPNASATILTDNAPVTVAQGGTGAATLAAHGLVVGNGTSAVNVTGAGTAGQVLTSNGAAADATFQAPTGGISGPGSSTDRGIATYNGTTGATLRSTTLAIDANNVLNSTFATWYLNGSLRFLATPADFSGPYDWLYFPAASSPNGGSGGNMVSIWKGAYCFTAGSNAENGVDACISRPAANVISFDTAKPSTGTNGDHGAWPQWAGSKFLAASGTNSTATLSPTGLSVSVTLGRKYIVDCHLRVANSVAAEGVQVDFGGGTAAATDFRVEVKFTDATLVKAQQTTALATAVSVATFTGDGEIAIHGSFEPSGSGTFIPRYAENSHATGTITIYRGSDCILQDAP